MTKNKTDRIRLDQLPKDLQFFTYDEVAALLKVKRATVTQWVYKGMLRADLRAGIQARIRRSDFDEFIEKRAEIRRVKTHPLYKKVKHPGEETNNN